MRHSNSKAFGWATAMTLAACQVATPALKPTPLPPPAPLLQEVVTVQEPSVAPPQPSYISPPRPFPKIETISLENGLQIDVIERHALPVVALELVVYSGFASEGNRAGAAKITPEWLEAGGAGRWNSQQLRESVDDLGASLEISVNRDSARWSLAVTSDRISPALDILGALVQSPHFDRAEFEKLRQRELERVRSLARTNGPWMAQMLLQRRLFRLPIGVHPYASFDVLPSELLRLDAAACRGWFRQFVTPHNARLVVVGDVGAARMRAEIEQTFGHWKGPEVPGFHPSEPETSGKFEIFVVDRPNSTQSDIYLAFLGPNSRDPGYPEVAIAQQIVGGGVAGRLFLDVREKRSLAYSTGAGVQELAQGPSVLYFAAGTQTPKTAETVGALLEHLERMGSGSILPDELDAARHYLVDSMPTRWEQVQSLAAQLTQLRVLGLPSDHYDAIRRRIGLSSIEWVSRAAREFYRRERSIVVIAGDGDAIASSLTKYGPVTRVDPAQEFRFKDQFASSPPE
jgi:zinc protease